MAEDLEPLRARIDEIDAAIIRLLGERFTHVRLLGRWKALANLPVENKERENHLRALYLAAAQRESLDPALVLKLFEVVLEHSKAEQRGQGKRPKTA